MTYQKNVDTYWSAGYDSANVESHLFRVFGRVFDFEFGLDGSGGESILDYGCGQGEACRYLASKGFSVYGVDTSEKNIEVCLDKFPSDPVRFKQIPFEVRAADAWFEVSYDIVISIQVLYYLNPADLRERLQNLYQQMKPGAYIYATMMGTSCWYYEHATKLEDGMYRVDLACPRFTLSDYRVTFMHSEDEVRETFRMFEPVHVGFYGAKFRADEGQDFHYTFIGRK